MNPITVFLTIARLAAGAGLGAAGMCMRAQKRQDRRINSSLLLAELCNRYGIEIDERVTQRRSP
jgi:hypothetical protein